MEDKIRLNDNNMTPPIVTLLTDFGTADGYVGEVKGVLLSHCPDAVVVDISHDVPAHDVEVGRLTLARYWRRFPRGTVHLVVVDPGVGSSRAALAIESDGCFLVGPDNGVLSPALLAADARSVRLSVPGNAAPTFHGRDVFAPAAARLACGTPLEELGVPAGDPVVRRTPEPHRGARGEVIGQVIAIDRFGNAVTNLLCIRDGTIFAAGREMAVRRTYADLQPGEAGAVVGSTGLIEIVVREGRAADALSLGRGAQVILR